MIMINERFFVLYPLFQKKKKKESILEYGDATYAVQQPTKSNRISPTRYSADMRRRIVKAAGRYGGCASSHVRRRRG